MPPPSIPAPHRAPPQPPTTAHTLQRQAINRELFALRVAMRAAESLTANIPANLTLIQALHQVRVGSKTTESTTLWPGKDSAERDTDLELAGLKVAFAVAEELVAGTWKARVLRAARVAAERAGRGDAVSGRERWEGGAGAKETTTRGTQTQTQSGGGAGAEGSASPPPYAP